MKKLGILFFAALLVVAFTMPAAAFESEFGGYWRTRFYTNQNFSGEDTTEARDFRMVDTRTRLYYTAILNDNLKLVNKFEMDAAWGDARYGDIGADGIQVEVKNTYADFNIGSVNAKIGAHYGELARCFLFADDFSGATITFKGEGFSIPVMWVKAYEADGEKGYWGDDFSSDDDQDFDYYAINPTFNLGDNLSINPFYMMATSNDASAYGKFNGLASPWANELNDGLGAVVDDVNTLIAGAIKFGLYGPAYDDDGDPIFDDDGLPVWRDSALVGEASEDFLDNVWPGVQADITDFLLGDITAPHALPEGEFDFYEDCPLGIALGGPFEAAAAAIQAFDPVSVEATLDVKLDLEASAEVTDIDMHFLGLNLDYAFDGGGVWFTGIYQFGSVDAIASISGTLTETIAVTGNALIDGTASAATATQSFSQDLAIDTALNATADIKAWLLAAGGNINLGGASVHGQGFYATGQDPDDEDITAFTPPKGASYYWAEILGYGTFDWGYVDASPNDQISNIMAFNLGASVSPMDKLSLGLDVWYATLVEEDENGNDKLGTEVDLSASYELVENLNLDIVAAYLFAGDAVYDGADDANPFELGAQLSLKF